MIMCGRFTLRTPTHVLGGQFAAVADIVFEPRFNVAPSQPIAAVRLNPDGQPGERHLVALRWGLIPSWAKEASIGNRMINARSETVAEKPAFRAAFRRRRCLVPADGFFEWQRRGKAKQPYFIHLPDERPFAMAGLWESWEGPDQSLIESCTILTTAPNEVMAPIHDRMPVILPAAAQAVWLDGEASADDLKALLVPLADEPLQTRAVSPYVNRPTNDGPECVAPVRTLFDV